MGLLKLDVQTTMCRSLCTGKRYKIRYSVQVSCVPNRTVVYLVHLVLCCVQPNSCVCDCISVLYAGIPIRCSRSNSVMHQAIE